MSKNFAYSTVASPAPGASGVSLTVRTGHGSRFYVGKATVFPAGATPSPDNAEVLSVTAVNGDTLTVTRAVESSSARTIGVGDVVVQGVTATMWDDLVALVATKASASLDADGTLTVNGTTVEVATDAQLAALSGTYAAIGRGLAAGAAFGVTGDSITIVNSDTANNLHSDSWATHCVLASAGTLRMAVNAGRGGYTSTQLLALLDADVLSIADAPEVVGIAWGTNDGLDGSNKPTTTAANTKAAVAAIRAKGAFPFLCTIPPQGVPALATPAAPTLTASTSGGTIATGTVYYKVTLTNAAGETLPSSAASVAVTGPTGSVAVDIAFVEGATGAKVYVSSDNVTFRLVGTITSGAAKWAQRYTDTVGTSAGATPPGSNTTAVAADSTAHLKIHTINAWLRAYARAEGIPLVDQFAILADSTTGTYRQGYSGDGTHPTSTRQKYMGVNAWSVLSKFVPGGAGQLAYDNADPLNLFGNGCLINGSGSLPTSWASYAGSSSGITNTLGTKTGFAGKAFTSERTIPDVRFNDSPSYSTGFSVGDVLSVAFMVQVESAETGGGVASYEVRLNGSNTSPVRLVLTAADVGPAVWQSRLTVPAGTTSFYIKGPYLSTGPVKASIGQITVYNETTGAFLATAP